MEGFITESVAKANWKKEKLKSGEYDKIYYIETEETEYGFPDVIAIKVNDLGVNEVSFFEFKITNKYNRIKFQKSQPVWYIKNRKMNPKVIVWHNKRKEFLMLNGIDIPSLINDKLEVTIQ